MRLPRPRPTGARAGALLLRSDPAPGADFAGLILMGALLAPVFATLMSPTPAQVGPAHGDGAIGFQVAAAAGGASLTVAVGRGAERFGLEVTGPVPSGAAVVLPAVREALARAAGRPDTDEPASSAPERSES